ncbi:EAL domain-containing protein [Noviherbaspirillum sp.]|uniref:EAL domain-containing protein n=1 Tax=Noviherbaspirillum sp. TaxID=1926288 RepID=UPI002D6DFC4D|nr:EAL domain-containing protein [Noviherbaspirillum sp.]HZW20856.1 EAL domain-containing protein [Noviherbaspirillum sp.]
MQMLQDIHEILSTHDLLAEFQPIVDLRTGHIFGHEGLIRGPKGTALESPLSLLGAARQAGRGGELERLCVRILWERFQSLGLPGMLFLNLSLPALCAKDEHGSRTPAYLSALGMDPRRIVIELTEDQTVSCYRRARRVVSLCRLRGFAIGIDDLGAGYSSLRLWLELAPEYVKVDMAFVRGADKDDKRLEFLRSVQKIAATFGTKVIAEGIESEAEYDAVRRLGLPYGQGYFIGRPSASPAASIRAA